ncbi:MAG: right-handed parallel beta-helix repeat-containing protein [Kiritimatiellaeota bacterium]|nr:right-handed parallel beta-helix repeat-containing protein [Kiritimatiellota bacterium]
MIRFPKHWKPARHLFPSIGKWLPGVLALWCVGGVSAAEFHVALSGQDTNPGTREQPFASLEKARDAARAARATAGAQPITLWVHGGKYFLTQPFELTAADSGRPGAPLVIRSVENETVVLCGARRLKATDFKPVTSAAALGRVAPEARGKLVELDLAAHGLAQRKPLPDLCYPNEGYMTMKRVLFNGGGQAERGRWGDKNLKQSKTGPGVFEYRDDRHARWVEAARRGALWVKGYWRCVWQNEAVRVGAIDPQQRTVTLAKAVPGGIGSKYFRPEGDGNEKYWVLNLLEEVDRPGEWCVDFQDGKLYLCPPCGWEQAELLLAERAAPVVRLADTSHVVLRQVTIEGVLDHGVLIRGGASNVLAGCTVRNVARYGVMVDGGSGHVVQSCDIHDTGAGGVWLGGGDENTSPRVPAGHRVVNCHIHHFGRLELVYAPGINSGFTGGGGGGHHTAVGMRVEHNLVHDGPHAGVLYGSWDSEFAFNEVCAFCEISNDMGAFYCYDRFERMGNHRLNYNFIHSSAQGDGIYFDCDHHGSQVYGNIVSLCSTGKWGTAFLYKTGKQAEHPQPIYCSNNIAVASSGGFNFITPRPGLMANNVAVKCAKPYQWQEVKAGKFIRGNASLTAGTNLTYSADPGFVNAAGLNFALRPDAQLLKDLPAFQRIPCDKIGLYVDEFRKCLPTLAEAGRVRAKGAVGAAGYEVLDRE